jgi:hypothetical protein
MPHFAGSGVSGIFDLSRYSKLEILHALICTHLSFVLICVYLRQKNLFGLDFIELNKELSVY